MRLKDLTGNRYGRLVVEGISHKSDAGVFHWNCLCDCGVRKSISRNALQQGLTQSCGCLKREQTIERTTKHGMSKTRTYAVWAGIIERVSNPDRQHAEYYAQKGITVSESWRKFENFYADMGDAPKGLWIERIDNNGNYCKENCRWDTPSRQGSNRGKKTNTSGRLGVSYDKSARKWRALIKIGGIKIDCGRFTDFYDACLEIDKAELKHLGYSRKEGFLQK